MKNFLIFLFLAWCCALEASTSKYNASYKGYDTVVNKVYSWHAVNPVDCSVTQTDEFLVIKKDSECQIFIINKKIPSEFFLYPTLKYEAQDSKGKKVMIDLVIKEDVSLDLWIKYPTIHYYYKLNL